MIHVTSASHLGKINANNDFKNLFERNMFSTIGILSFFKHL